MNPATVPNFITVPDGEFPRNSEKEIHIVAVRQRIIKEAHFINQCLTKHNRDGITGRVVEKTGKPWEIHRYRSVEEPVLAESLIWDLLGYPQSNDRELININVRMAEQAFRDFTPQMQRKIAEGDRSELTPFTKQRQRLSSPKGIL